MSHIDETALHGSLRDPVMGSLNFLNEITARYPDAISFAPGAPNLIHLDDLDVTRCIDLFVNHLRTDCGFTAKRARRLLYEYGPSRGIINDLVARALRADFDIGVCADDIVITVGAQEAMLVAVRALCRPGTDLLAITNPSFVGITGAARLLDVGIVPVDEVATGLDLDYLVAACRRARAEGRRIRAFYVAPDFANPSGTVLDLATRKELLDIAEREDLFLLEDNAYGFTAQPGAELAPLKAMDENRRVLYLGTFAKVCLPGARVGFVVADQVVRDAAGSTGRLADHLATLKCFVTVNTSPISQAIIGGMLLDHRGSLAELGRHRSEVYRRNLVLLVRALDRTLPANTVPPRVTWNRPDGGFFVRMRLPIRADAALMERSAAEYGVLWTPMSQFYLDAKGDSDLRLSCSYLDPDQIGEGTARLTGFLAGAGCL